MVFVASKRGETSHMGNTFVVNQDQWKKGEYILADQRLLTTVNDYNRDIIEYLRGIAHNFLME